MIMNAGLFSFVVGCCMSYKNTAALSPVGTLSTHITSLSWLLVTLSDFLMISSMVFALINIFPLKPVTVPKYFRSDYRFSLLIFHLYHFRPLLLHRLLTVQADFVGAQQHFL